MIVFLGKMLSQYGIYFQKHWEEEQYQATIFSRFTYGKHHSNQHIPIIRFDKDKFVICNQAYTKLGDSTVECAPKEEKLETDLF